MPGTGLRSKGRLVALPTIISLRWNPLTVTNTLACYDTEFITTVKSFTVRALGVNGYKTFSPSLPCLLNVLLFAPVKCFVLVLPWK